MKKSIIITKSATKLIRNFDADEVSKNNQKRFSVEFINEDETGLDYDYFSTEKEAENYINNSIVIPSENGRYFERNGLGFISLSKENVIAKLQESKDNLEESAFQYDGLDFSQVMKFNDSFGEVYLWTSDSYFEDFTELGESVSKEDFITKDML